MDRGATDSCFCEGGNTGTHQIYPSWLREYGFFGGGEAEGYIQSTLAL